MGKEHLKSPIFSKFSVLALIIVAVIAAAIVIWLSYMPVANNPETSSTTISDTTSTAGGSSSDASPDASEINDEISQLDSIIGNVDDASLSDNGYSDSDIGI